MEEQKRIQEGMMRFNFLGKNDILNLIDVKNGVRVYENSTLRKQNIVSESIKGFKMKRHVSEKMLALYLNDLKNKEKNRLNKIRKVNHDFFKASVADSNKTK